MRGTFLGRTARTRVDLLARLDQHRAGEALEEAVADALQGLRRAEQPARIGRREIERAADADRREAVVAQQARELRGAEGMARAERRAVRARPDAAPVGSDHQEPAVARHHPPDLLQHVPQMLAALDRMGEQHAVHGGVGQRQVGLVHQRRRVRPLGRPMQHALLRGHERHHPSRLVAELAQEGRGIAQAQHRLAAHVRPGVADAAAQQMARHLAQAGSRRNP